MLHFLLHRPTVVLTTLLGCVALGGVVATLLPISLTRHLKKAGIQLLSSSQKAHPFVTNCSLYTDVLSGSSPLCFLVGQETGGLSVYYEDVVTNGVSFLIGKDNPLPNLNLTD